MHHPVLQLDQFALQPKQFLEVEVPVQVGSLAGWLRRFGDQCIHAVVVDFHFQLFVEAIQHLGMNLTLVLQAFLGLVCAHGNNSEQLGEQPVQ